MCMDHRPKKRFGHEKVISLGQSVHMLQRRTVFCSSFENPAAE